MKSRKQFKLTAIVVLSLGIIHSLATPLVLPALKPLPMPDYLSFGYMFVMTGFAVLFMGIIQLIALKDTTKSGASMKVLRLSSWFVFIAGVTAVGVMYHSFNPFAYIMLLVAAYQLYLLKKLTHESN